MEDLNLTNKKVYMVIAFKDFRDEELLIPKEILENQGAEVLVVSTELGEAQGVLREKVEVDLTIFEMDIASCDAVVFVGGPGAASLFENPTALQIAKEAFEKGKIVAAICIAPMILANAGVLKGKNATAFSSLGGKFKELGINYLNEDVVVSETIITAQDPKNAQAFGEKIALLLSQRG